MTNSVKTKTIPAQRYFTEAELCQLLGISAQQFQAWQRDYGLVGYGGKHYTRLQLIQLQQIKATFAPYVDAFTHNFVDEQGEEAMDALELKIQLSEVLRHIQEVLALNAISQSDNLKSF